MNDLREMFPESRTALHLVEHLDCHDVHFDKLVTHLVFLGSAQEQRHYQIQVIIQDLQFKLGEEEDGFLRDLNMILG